MCLWKSLIGCSDYQGEQMTQDLLLDFTSTARNQGRATREAKLISPVIFLEKQYPKLRLGVGKGESSLQKGVCSKQLPNSLMQRAAGSGAVRVGLQV